MKISGGRLLLSLQLALNGLWLCAASTCTRNTSFQSLVLVIHDGIDFDKVEAGELTALSQAFKDAWATTNDPSANKWCDATHSKTLTAVSVREENLHLTHQATEFRDARKTFLYEIKGACANGCKDFKLYNEPLVKSPGRERDLMTKLAPLEGKCPCDEGKDDRSPTELEFLSAFQAEIALQRKLGNVKSVKKVYDVIEYRPFGCSDQEVEFIEDVLLELEPPVAPGDEKALEEGYIDAYNTLSKYFCDLGDNHVIDAHMLPVGERTLRGRRKLAKRLLKSRKKKRTKQEEGAGDDGNRRLTTTTVKVFDTDGRTYKTVELDQESFDALQKSGTKYEVVSTPQPTTTFVQGATYTVLITREDGTTQRAVLDASSMPKLEAYGMKYEILSVSYTYTVKVTNKDGTTQTVTLDEASMEKLRASGLTYEIISPILGPKPVTYGHTCYCPLRPIANRAPNEKEIRIAYQEMLNFEKKHGDLSTSYGVESVNTSTAPP